MSDGEVPQGAVIKVGLKRLNLEERVLGDEELRRCQILLALGEPLTRELVASGVGKRFADAARIFVQGDPGDALVLLLKGEARLTSGAASVDVDRVHKGEVLGEREALGETTHRCFTAQAVGEVELMEVPAEAVRTLIGRCPAFADHLRDICARRKVAGAELEDFLNRW